MIIGLPLIVIQVKVLDGLSEGSKSTVTATFTTPQIEVRPGAVTVGGTLSIRAVQPSSGLMAAGTTLQILGTGFNGGTVDIPGVAISNTRVISDREIDVTLGGSLEMAGQRIIVRGASGKSVDFFTSMESAPVTTDPDDPFANAHPILPLRVSPTAMTQHPSVATGWLVLNNPNATSLDVTVEEGALALPSAFSVSRQRMISIAAGTTTNVPFGVTNRIGFDTLRVIASQPIRSVLLYTQRSLVTSATFNGGADLKPVDVLPLRIEPRQEVVSLTWHPGQAKIVSMPLLRPQRLQSVLLTVGQYKSQDGVTIELQ
ncbi:MAG: hypothetical protein HYZ37_16150 [Candidatus Solibacter usitatus]|nr:hypothetical protein [Candidatus Solibacter usitatus]